MTRVRVNCPTDGMVDIATSNIEVHIVGGRAEGLFFCPICRREFSKFLDFGQIGVLESVHVPVFREGASYTYSSGANPPPRPDLYDQFVCPECGRTDHLHELTCSTVRPAITRDELLDFHEGLTDEALAEWLA